MPRSLAFSISLALLASCASTESSPVVEELTTAEQPWEANHSQSADAVLNQDWWSAFERPSLNLAVSTALANNYDLMAAAARVQAVAAQARAVAGDRLPKVNAGLGLSRSRTNLIGLPFPGSPDVLPITNNNHSLGMDISWELDLWGRIAASENAAIANLQASDAEYAATRLSLAGQTAKAWMMRADAAAQLDIAQAQLQNATEQLAFWKLRFKNGGSADAVHQAQASLSLARAAIPAATEQLQLWQRQVATLMGGYPSHASELNPAALPQLPGPVPAGLPAGLVHRRPDLVRAEAKVRQARFTSAAADAALYPTLALTGSSGLRSNALKDLLDYDFRTWSLGASLTAPIFHGGTLNAQAEAAEKLTVASELQFAQSVLRALAEVENALGSEDQIQTRVVQIEQQLAALQQRTSNTETRYQLGAGGPSSIYLQRAEALRAASSLHSARLLLLLNRIDLYLALGGGFQLPAPR